MPEKNILFGLIEKFYSIPASSELHTLVIRYPWKNPNLEQINKLRSLLSLEPREEALPLKYYDDEALDILFEFYEQRVYFTKRLVPDTAKDYDLYEGCYRELLDSLKKTCNFELMQSLRPASDMATRRESEFDNIINVPQVTDESDAALTGEDNHVCQE